MGKRRDKDFVLTRTTGTSGANAAQTVTSPLGQRRRLFFVTVKYSATPTQTGTTVTLNSGEAAVYDTLLATGSSNTQDTVYIPDEEIVIDTDDVIDVLAPAGGGVITSAIAIYTEVL